jgi:hypothetical protein
MDKSLIKKDIAALVKTINEHIAVIENTAHCTQQQTTTLVNSVEQLYKKVIVLDFVNSQVPVAETKTEPIPITKPVEIPTIKPAPAIEKIMITEAPAASPSVQQVINTPLPVEETKNEESLPKPKSVEKVETAAPLIVKQIVKEQVHASETKPSPKRDIKTAIGINDKFEFISELFKGNTADYEASIQLFNNTTNNEAALSLFNDLQKKYNWEDENETVNRFLEIIKRGIH